MVVIDYNGEGPWSREQITERYARHADELGIVRRHDLSPTEHSERGRHWVYPVMQKVIDGIKAGDPACVRLGIEFIEEDGHLPFGRTLKSNAARALRRATLSDEQKERIRRRVFAMLRAGHVPREFGDYAKLVRHIGFDRREVPDVDSSKPHAVRHRSYFISKTLEGGGEAP
jgi:hypothetical protein